MSATDDNRRWGDPPADEVVVPPQEVARLQRFGRPIQTVEEAEWDRADAWSNDIDARG